MKSSGRASKTPKSSYCGSVSEDTTGVTEHAQFDDVVGYVVFYPTRQHAAPRDICTHATMYNTMPTHVSVWPAEVVDGWFSGDAMDPPLTVKMMAERSRTRTRVKGLADISYFALENVQ